MTLKPSINCPCRNERIAEVLSYSAPPVGETDFGFSRESYCRSFDECTTCGHYFGRHDLPVAKIYEADYVDSTYGSPEGMVDRLNKILSLPPEQSDNALRVTRIRHFFAATRPQATLQTESHRLLDVGAGIGVFPAAMKAEGWEVVAIEPDARTVRMLRSRVEIEALEKDFLELDTAQIGHFSCVTFNKVLEHVEDPSFMLSHAVSFLEEGGFCYVEVPDVRAAESGKGREEFFVEHHHVFSPSSLSLLVEHSGFDLVSLQRIVEPSGKFTLCAFMKARPNKQNKMVSNE